MFLIFQRLTTFILNLEKHPSCEMKVKKNRGKEPGSSHFTISIIISLFTQLFYFGTLPLMVIIIKSVWWKLLWVTLWLWTLQFLVSTIWLKNLSVFIIDRLFLLIKLINRSSHWRSHFIFKLSSQFHFQNHKNQDPEPK